MKRIITTLIFSFIIFNIKGQNKMRSVEELINTTDPGWVFVKEWIDSAKNKVEILPVDYEKAKKALFNTQVTTRSPMGAVVYETGGILVDNGWIKILGSGSDRLNRSLPDWNKGKSFDDFGQPVPYLLIADDAIGGFFILNGGGLGKDLGKVYYFAPENLEYEALDLTYSEFLNFCFNDNLDKFYKNFIWTNWKDDLEKLKGDEVFNFFPLLWTKQGKEINTISKKVIPIEEQYNLNIDLRSQLGID